MATLLSLVVAGGSSFDADGEVYTTGSHAIGSLGHDLTNNLSSHTVVHANSSSKD